MSYEIKEDKNFKIFKSDNYNYRFVKSNGYFVRFGKTIEEDPDYSPFGPEIADIEISSACPSDKSDGRVVMTSGGCDGIGCKKFCYKGNCADKSVHMTVETFKKVLDKMPKTLTQIALGICSINSSPFLWQIIDEGRRRGLAMNLTTNGVGITDDIAKHLVAKCGAVAVSVNPHNKEIAYEAIAKLSKYGMEQVNIHIVLAEDTVPFIYEVSRDSLADVRLKGLNAIVMLSFKDKAKTGCYQPIKYETYKKLVDFMFANNIKIGFDSCGAKMFEAYANGDETLLQCCEPCESGLFSWYINTYGYGFACSFYENEEEWENGIDMLSVGDGWWNCNKVLNWRQRLLNNKRHCPLYQIG